VADRTLMIDLSGMKEIRVDASRRTAFAEAGLRLGDFDAATQALGLATTLGLNSDTGIAGLTLGGGLGRLARKHGLACDNLLAAEVLLADGRRLTASAEEHADLFWGLRGGGGNFGIVAGFRYALHPLGPAVLGGVVLWDFARAGEVLRFGRSGPCGNMAHRRWTRSHYLGDVPWEDHPEAKLWSARFKSRPSFRPLLQDRLVGLKPAAHYDDLDF
jgi:FAD/FMN-containing dehydrogenase